MRYKRSIFLLLAAGLMLGTSCRQTITGDGAFTLCRCNTDTYFLGFK